MNSPSRNQKNPLFKSLLSFAQLCSLIEVCSNIHAKLKTSLFSLTDLLISSKEILFALE